uniref:Uncharacterized protein n=1 Tax=Acidobacterium capsulatum TaxID=33075 RepID=A0A7V4XQK8_9BACT
MRACWLRPGLLARELAWRWGYGVPALLLTAYECWRIYQQARAALLAVGLRRFSFTHVNQSAFILAEMMQVLQPAVSAVAMWLLPLLGVGWALAFGFGRIAVLHRYAPELPRKPWGLAAMQALRLAGLGVALALWWRSIQWAAFSTSHGGRAPDLTAYFGLVFLFSLGFAGLWAVWGWIFYASPLLLLLEGRGFAASLVQSLRPRPWSARLAQANLGISLIRLMLALLSIALSGLPVSLGLAGLGLYLWWTMVSVLYLVASTFLGIVRQGIFLELWKSAPAA